MQIQKITTKVGVLDTTIEEPVTKNIVSSLRLKRLNILDLDSGTSWVWANPVPVA